MQDIDDQALNRANIILFPAYFVLLYHSIITKHTHSGMIMVVRTDKAHYNPCCVVLFQRGTFTSHAAGNIKDAHMPHVDNTFQLLK